MTVNFLFVFAVVISLPVIGEAVALVIGVHVMRRGRSWRSIKNDVLLISDVAAGTAVLCLAIIDANVYRSIPFYVFTTLLLITHAYRQREYLVEANNPFCDNKPLLIVNNIKLIGLAVILIYGLVLL